MVTIRDRNMPGGWRVALVEDNRRNRYIEIFDKQDRFVKNITPADKLYALFDAMLLQSPVIDDKELMELYETTTKGLTDTRGRVLAYARAVIDTTREHWGMK
jgi:hypothetical protein